jgi:hypothetical protein
MTAIPALPADGTADGPAAGPAPSLLRIVSGGQTGVDRAALDVALALGIPCGGWVPRHRRAEDGRIADHYPLRETASTAYDVRTRFNVRDSDATLILARGRPTGGTALTAAIALTLGRPHQIVDLALAADPAETGIWLRRHQVRILNVAGPRESNHPGIYAAAAAFLRVLLAPGRS